MNPLSGLKRLLGIGDAPQAAPNRQAQGQNLQRRANPANQLPTQTDLTRPVQNVGQMRPTFHIVPTPGTDPGGATGFGFQQKLPAAPTLKAQTFGQGYHVQNIDGRNQVLDAGGVSQGDTPLPERAQYIDPVAKRAFQNRRLSI